MSAKRTTPRPPAGLAAAGKSLWKAILGDLSDGWEFDQRELHYLRRACRCEDEMRKLEAAVDAEGPTSIGSRGQTVVHPALGEARAALSAMYSTAVEDGKVPYNPVKGVRIPPAPTDPLDQDDEAAKNLTREELRLLLTAIPEDWRLFFEFLAVTGLRISEAVGLTWEHLELGDKPHIEVREQVYEGQRKRLKSKKARRDVPLSPAMSARLLAHRRDTYSGPKAPVFATITGTALSPANVYGRVLAPAAISVGLYVEVEGKGGKPRKRSTVSFHTFRHTCASMLFDQGRNVKQVSEWLGHAKTSFTLDTYVHTMDAEVGEGLDLDAQGNTGATRGLQAGANPTEAKSPEIA